MLYLGCFSVLFLPYTLTVWFKVNLNSYLQRKSIFTQHVWLVINFLILKKIPLVLNPKKKMIEPFFFSSFNLVCYLVHYICSKVGLMFIKWKVSEKWSTNESTYWKHMFNNVHSIFVIFNIWVALRKVMWKCWCHLYYNLYLLPADARHIAVAPFKYNWTFRIFVRKLWAPCFVIFIGKLHVFMS